MIAYWLITLPLGYWWGMVATQDPLEGTMGFWKAMIIGIAVSSIVLVMRLLRTLRKPLLTA